jgi:hypothetical protein
MITGSRNTVTCAPWIWLINQKESRSFRSGILLLINSVNEAVNQTAEEISFFQPLDARPEENAELVQLLPGQLIRAEASFFRQFLQ